MRVNSEDEDFVLYIGVLVRPISNTIVDSVYTIHGYGVRSVGCMTRINHRINLELTIGDVYCILYYGKNKIPLYDLICFEHQCNFEKKLVKIFGEILK